MDTIVSLETRNIFRLSFEWAGKGGIFRRTHNGFAIRLRAFAKFTRKLIGGCSRHETLDQDDPREQVDFDCDVDFTNPDGLVFFDCDVDFGFGDEDGIEEQQLPHCDGGEEEEKEEEEEEEEETNGVGFTYLYEDYNYEDKEMNGDPDIDLKAVEFIAMVHELWRLERQRSLERLNSASSSE